MHRTIPDLCADAGIRYRVSGGVAPTIVVWRGPNHGRTVDDDGNAVYAVDRHGLPQGRAARAAAILEILAYGFQDYFARESVCGRDIFVYPVRPEHGRLWLSSIGARGGRSRSTSKSAASRKNGGRSA